MEEKYDFSKFFDEKKDVKNISVANVCEMNGFDSGIPKDEREASSIREGDTNVVYTKALIKNTASPVFVGIPHSGEFVPKDILDRVSIPRALAEGVDMGTAYIFSPSEKKEDENYLAVRNRISRTIADPNRGPRQLGQNLGIGGGVTWKTNMQDVPIYKTGQEPTDKEVIQNVDSFYTPYYTQLHNVLASLHESMGYQEILFLDGHSFPGDVDVPKVGLVASVSKPMFILGSQGSLKADEEVMRVFVDALITHAPRKEDYPDMFEKISEIATIETRPGWGGFRNVEYFGHPQGIKVDDTKNISAMPFKVHAIQMEINASAFRTNGKYNSENLESIRQTVQAAIREIGEFLKIKNKK